jgi:hypothetical protein
MQKLLSFLQVSGWVSSMVIAKVTNSVAVHSDISDLRDNGKEIECKYMGLSENGRKIYAYKLLISEDVKQEELQLA